jgi:hypothetical protein
MAPPGQLATIVPRQKSVFSSEYQKNPLLLKGISVRVDSLPSAFIVFQHKRELHRFHTDDWGAISADETRR